MMNDFKVKLNGKRNITAKQSYEEIIDQIVLVSDKYNEKVLRALELLKQYFITGKENYYKDYLTIQRETEPLNNEVRKLIYVLFSVKTDTEEKWTITP